MKNLTATIKGLITGVVMILLSLAIYAYRGNFDSALQYIVYAVYVAGIVWALSAYSNSTAEQKNFKAYFTQGFKCFIVVTLLMVAFTWIFLKINPGLEIEMAKNYKADLITKNNYTPREIEEMVLNARKYFIIMLTSLSIFGYLVIGSLITTIAAIFFSRIKKN